MAVLASQVLKIRLLDFSFIGSKRAREFYTTNSEKSDILKQSFTLASRKGFNIH